MKRHPAFFVLTALVLSAVPSVLAHPGHEGHELIWDFHLQHLTAHPLATLACCFVIGAIGWNVWRLLRPAAERQISASKVTRQKR